MSRLRLHRPTRYCLVVVANFDGGETAVVLGDNIHRLLHLD